MTLEEEEEEEEEGEEEEGRRREKRWVIEISEEVILCTYYLSPIQIDY